MLKQAGKIRAPDKNIIYVAMNVRLEEVPHYLASLPIFGAII